MSFFDKIISQLFPQTKEGKKKSTHLPMVTSSLSRSKKNIEGYKKWLNSTQQAELINMLSSSYHKRKHDIASNDVQSVILNSPYSKGFAFYWNKNIPQDEFLYFFDWLKDSMVSLGYHCKNSDCRIYDRDNFVETIEKHYLKPAIKYTSPSNGNIYNQQYGNILIELKKYNDQPFLLKLQANIYAGRQYSTPYPFDSLATKLLNKEFNQ